MGREEKGGECRRDISNCQDLFYGEFLDVLCRGIEDFVRARVENWRNDGNKSGGYGPICARLELCSD